MPGGSVFIVALLVQVAAQAFGGVWGAAAGGVLIGLVDRGRGSFLTGFFAALVAAALLLAATSMRGVAIWDWAAMIADSLKLPVWVLIAATLLLPALQSGGLAGGVGRLLGGQPTRR